MSVPGTLLVGPTPPPHGGISVHVETVRRARLAAGEDCEVLDPGADRDRAGRVRRTFRLIRRIRRRARNGWRIHVHTNGHNRTSWLVLALCGFAAGGAPARLATLHSGLLPGAVASASRPSRAILRMILRRYDRVVCVGTALRSALVGIGVDAGRLAVEPAHRPVAAPAVVPPPAVERWLRDHDPVLSAAAGFRPEYGVDVLLRAVEILSVRFPRIGLVVAGGGGDDEEAVRREIAACGLGDRTFLAGDVPHDLCLALIGRSDLFVRPTRADGDALSVREALDLGVPVVATDVGTRPPGVVRVPVDDPGALADAVGTLLMHREGREAAGRRAS